MGAADLDHVAVGPRPGVGEPLDRRDRRRRAPCWRSPSRPATHTSSPTRTRPGPSSTPGPAHERRRLFTKPVHGGSGRSSRRWPRCGCARPPGRSPRHRDLSRHPLHAASRLGEQPGGADDHLRGDAIRVVGAPAADEVVIDPRPRASRASARAARGILPTRTGDRSRPRRPGAPAPAVPARLRRGLNRKHRHRQIRRARAAPRRAIDDRPEALGAGRRAPRQGRARRRSTWRRASVSCT